MRTGPTAGKILTLFLLLMSVLLVFSGCGKTQREKLVVGIESNFPPYEYYQGDSFTGIDPEIMKYVANELDMELVFEDISFDYLLSALQEKKIDVAASAITITKERAQRVAFTHSYAESGLVVVVRKDSSIRSVKDLQECAVGVQKGSTGDEYAARHFRHPVRFPNVGLAAEKLLSGKIDALITDQGPVSVLVRKEKVLKILSEPLTREQYAFAVHKDRKALLARINHVLEKMEKNGMIRRIRARHEEFIMRREDRKDPEKAPIRVAVDPTFPPIGYVQNGEILGIEPELLQRIAKELNRNVHFEQVGFDSLFEAVANDNDVNVGAGSISITEERKKIVSFTIPYCDSRQSLYLPADSPVTEPAQMKGRLCGAIYESTAESFVRKHYGEPECFSEGELLFRALSEKKIDGAVMDDFTGKIFMKRFRNIRRLPVTLLQEQYAFAVRKENRELLEQMNAILRKFHADGTIRQIMDKHFRKFEK